MHEYVEENGEKKMAVWKSWGWEEACASCSQEFTRPFFLGETTCNLLLIQTIYYFVIFNIVFILNFIFLYHCVHVHSNKTRLLSVYFGANTPCLFLSPVRDWRLSCCCSSKTHWEYLGWTPNKRGIWQTSRRQKIIKWYKWVVKDDFIKERM